MKISELFRQNEFVLSVEIFPPKNEKGETTLQQTLEKLSRYNPAFISCTYGAGGSTREATFHWCDVIQQKYRQTATAHFTCVGFDRQQLCNWLSKARELGIENIMALRGDPPQGEEAFQTVEGGFSHANELVALIRSQFPEFGIGVAGYPETHPETPNPQTDLENLKRKVEAGADAVFTQLFFDNNKFFEFRSRYEKIGIAKPLVPGIMPITEFSRIKRITSMCGATIPEELASRLESVRDDKKAQFEIGVEHAIQQCRELKERGVPGIHFYVLNRTRACERILKALGFFVEDAASP